MQAIGRAGKQPWTRDKVRRILRSWHTYLLPLLYILWNNGGYQNAMGYWLKSFNADPPPVPGVSFTISQINNRTYPLPYQVDMSTADRQSPLSAPAS